MPVSRERAGLVCALSLRRRLGSLRHYCADRRRTVGESPHITYSPLRKRPPPRINSKRASCVYMGNCMLPFKSGLIIGFPLKSRSPHHVRRLVTPHARAIIQALSWVQKVTNASHQACLFFLLVPVNYTSTKWIFGSFFAPGAKGEEGKGQIYGLVLTGEIWTLVWDIGATSVVTWCTLGIRRRSNDEICWHKVHLWGWTQELWTELICERVQYTYPPPPIPPPPHPRYLLS